MKKILSSLLAVTLIFAMFQTGAIGSLALTCGDYTYSVTGTSAAMTGYNGIGGDIEIPDELDGYAVTEIAANAFNGCDILTSAIIPDTVTVIRNNAFDNCLNLTRVTIGSAVATIGSSAFDICPKLTAAYFLGDAPQIGSNIFGPGSNATYAQAYRTTVFYLEGNTGFEDNSSTYYPFDPYYPPYEYPIIVLPGGPYPPYITYPPGYYPPGYPPFVSPGFPSNRWYGYGTATFNLADLLVRSGSSAQLDPADEMIYGLQPCLTKAEFESSFVFINGNGCFRYSNSLEVLGTGTSVELLDSITNKVMETYRLIIFGDVNGDGCVDSIDAGVLVDMENYQTNWNPDTDTPFYEAADVNGDGSIDSIDAGILVDTENYEVTINQISGLAG